MPSTNSSSNMPDWLTTQRNLTILVAILVAVPIAYGFRVMGSSADYEGSFLLLMTLAVGVPTAYDEYWPKYDKIWNAVAWVFAACIVATMEFISLYLVGTEFGDLSPFLGSIGAFLITDLGNLAWLSVRSRRRNFGE